MTKLARNEIPVLDPYKLMAVVGKPVMTWGVPDSATSLWPAPNRDERI